MRGNNKGEGERKNREYWGKRIWGEWVGCTDARFRFYSCQLYTHTQKYIKDLPAHIFINNMKYIL